MSKAKSNAQRIMIQKAQERRSAGDQHYNHAWRSLDTAEARLLAVQRSHVEKPVSVNNYAPVFDMLLRQQITDIAILKAAVKEADDLLRHPRGEK